MSIPDTRGVPRLPGGVLLGKADRLRPGPQWVVNAAGANMRARYAQLNDLPETRAYWLDAARELISRAADAREGLEALLAHLLETGAPACLLRHLSALLEAGKTRPAVLVLARWLRRKDRAMHRPRYVNGPARRRTSPRAAPVRPGRGAAAPPVCPDRRQGVSVRTSHAPPPLVHEGCA